MGMVVRTNTMALNAYRQLGMNNNAVSKSLEKLSSGFRINRAADDAAGLAISEKMKAQIKGLETASANAQDGISLLQTAEGNLSEVHNMLNRMVELATKSANGTYSVTERTALQDEVDALLEEIDRISQSANFNGINLLDGSMGESGVAATEGVTGSFKLPDEGDTMVTNTVLHKGSSTATATSFSINLHELAFENKADQEMTLTIGEGANASTIKFTGNKAIGDATAGNTAKAADIAKAIATSTATTAATNGITAGGKIAFGTTAGKVTIDGETFSVKADGEVLTFTQDSITNKAIDGDMKVSVTGKGKDAVVAGTVTGTIAAAAPAEAKGSGAAETTYTYDLAGITKLAAGSYTVGLAGKTVTVTLDAETTDLKTFSDKIVAEFNKDTNNKISDGTGDYVVTSATGGKIVFTSSYKGDTSGDAVAGNLTVTPATAAPAGDSGVTGDYNTQTTVTTTGEDASGKRIASTVIDLTKEMMSDGAAVIIGGKEYTFTTKEDDKALTGANADNKVYVGDLDLSKAADMKTAIDRLSVVADSNEVWSVGYAGSAGKVTLVEKISYNNTGDFDLTKFSEIERSVGYKSAGTEAKAGTPLTLQIGDTADEFNKMAVSINDMSAKGLKLDGLSIMSQTESSDAIAKIKEAINTVSSTRAGMGALQNRLEYTINNLDVAVENLSAANSRIRDTDMAKEMMNYTKMNVLVQSAQAMLAQANQQPQSVLQLLQ